MVVINPKCDTDEQIKNMTDTFNLLAIYTEIPKVNIGVNFLNHSE